MAWGVYYVKLTFAYMGYYSEIYTGSALVVPVIVGMGALSGIIYIVKAKESAYNDYVDYEYS